MDIVIDILIDIYWLTSWFEIVMNILIDSVDRYLGRFFYGYHDRYRWWISLIDIFSRPIGRHLDEHVDQYRWSTSWWASWSISLIIHLDLYHRSISWSMSWSIVFKDVMIAIIYDHYYIINQHNYTVLMDILMVTAWSISQSVFCWSLRWRSTVARTTLTAVTDATLDVLDYSWRLYPGKKPTLAL